MNIHWQIDDIPWSQFDAAKVDPALLAQAKGAALVESNAADYVSYLSVIFADDPQVLKDLARWGREEELHGAVLRRWCEFADPSFDYEDALRRFRSAYRLPPAEELVRGSAARELVSRCVVETGTSTFYAALRDAAEEPVFREICRRIAGDEIRHFHLFYRHLNDRYAARERLGRWPRLKTVLQRVREAEDAELTFAHYAANLGPRFDARQFPAYSRDYMKKAFGYYRPRHFAMSAPMLLKAVGLGVRPRVSRWLGRAFYFLFRLKYVWGAGASQSASS